MKVATHGESTGYKVPCLIVAAKDDLNQSPHALQESTRVSSHCKICRQLLYLFFLSPLLKDVRS